MGDTPSLISGHGVIARLAGDSYEITSPYAARDLVKSLPGAKWDASRKVWKVKAKWHGKIAEACALLDKAKAEDAEKLKADELRKAQAAQLRDEQGLAALKAMEPFSGGVKLSFDLSGIRISTAYHPRIEEMLRIEGGRFKDGVWTLPIAAGKVIAASRDSLRDWHNTSVKADMAKREERLARLNARLLVAADGTAPVGMMVKKDGAWMRIESLGKIFRADEDTASLGGPQGIEGQAVRYAYLVPAFPEEAAAAQAREDKELAAAQKKAAKMAAILGVSQGEYAPEMGAEPEGEILWESGDGAAYRRWVILGRDGWIYHLTYDGTDGGAWGDCNAGVNTRAHRVPATEEMVEVIRG